MGELDQIILSSILTIMLNTWKIITIQRSLKIYYKEYYRFNTFIKAVWIFKLIINYNKYIQ